MGLIHAGLLLLVFCSTCSYQVRSGVTRGLFVQKPELEWARMETEISKETMPVPAPKGKLWRSALASPSTTPAPKTLPQYLIMSGAGDQKEDFKPGRGARPLSGSAVNMLIGSPSNALQTERIKDPKQLVEILCHFDRMYVRIKREVFKTIDAYKYLKLGTCPVNAGTQIHYYLLYRLITDCGFNQQVSKGYFCLHFQYISFVIMKYN